MDEPLLPALPVLSQQNRIEELVAQCQKASFKTNEFLIIYQSVGVDGTILPDEEFAQQLQQILEEEKLLNGKRARVTIVNETNCEIEEVLKQMSASVIVLVVFSEAALQTFSADNHGYRQNNYLLFLQFALQLHHAKGVRMLGLNLVAVDDSEAGVNAFVKFQGWCVNFSDVPHYSEVQDSISKSMKKIFAIQGITMDPEDWEFKVPTLFASLYAAQDEINASGWHLIKIIPWKSFSGLMTVFAYSLIPFFFIFTLIYWKCSKKSKGHREAYFNVSLFAAGISLLGVTIFSSVKGVLCSSALECEVMVRAGSRWALWREYSKECQQWGITCYAKENTDYMWNQDFNSECAQCVCSHLRTGDITNLQDEKSCTNDDEILFGSLTTVVFVVGLIIIFVALHRLQKQALVIKREIKIVSKSKNDKRSFLHVDDSV